MKNKNGAGETLTFLIIVFMMGLAVSSFYIAAYMFSGNGYDFRENEAEVLSFKVVDCLQENNFLRENFDFYVECEININTKENYFIRVQDSEGNAIVSEGIEDYAVTCYLDASKDNDAYPRCFADSFTKDGNDYYVLTASAQDSRRVFQ